MAPLFLRRAHEPGKAIGPLTPDQLLESVPSGDDCLSLHADDPYAPMDRELDRNDALRDALLAAFPWERGERYAAARFALFAGLVPVALLVVLDVDLLRGGYQGATAAMAVDVLSAVFVSVDLARRQPRHPHVTAATFGAAGLRLAQLVALRCGEANVLLLVLGAVASLAAVGCLLLAPTPRAVADHLRRALAIAPPTRLPPRTSPGFFRTIVYAIGAATVLPALLWTLRSSNAALSIQLGAFILFAVVVPYVGRVFVGGSETGRLRAVSALASAGRARSVARVATTALASLVLSFALVRGVQSGVETVAGVEQCVAGDTEATPKLKRFLDAQRSEVAASRTHSDPSWLLLTVIVVPIAEELVYRGLVQHTLRRRLKRRVAIGLAALLFGLAHLAVYRTAAYQPVLLGLSFGLAYERAGILASILVHMLWNLWLSI